jgi:hypothetical protein
MTVATILIIIAGFFINILIMYEVIKRATNTTKQIQLLECQLKILRSIAAKVGVDSEQIKKDLTPTKS